MASKSKCFIQQYFDSKGRYLLGSRRKFMFDYRECKLGAKRPVDPLNENKINAEMLSGLFYNCVLNVDRSFVFDLTDVFKITLLVGNKDDGAQSRDEEYVPQKWLGPTEQYSLSKYALLAWADKEALKEKRARNPKFNIEHYEQLKAEIRENGSTFGR